MANAETGTVEFDNLVLPDADAITAVRTLETGTVTRGALLKYGTGTKLVAADEYDSAEDIVTVAATDASGTDANINVFTFAALSAAAVAEASGLDSISEAIREQLVLRGITIKDTLSLS
jgi:hypothetical protein